MTGVYDVSSALISELLETNTKQNISTTAEPPTNSTARRRRRSLLAVSPSTPLKGITNPTTCLENGASMIFMVDNNNYPIYDADNLYNTNPFFDYGAFTELQEKHQLQSTKYTLFAFKFDVDGVYVFKTSSNSERRMVRNNLCSQL